MTTKDWVQIIREPDKDEFDAIATAEFETPLSQADIPEVLHIVSQVLHSSVVKHLFEGMTDLQINQKQLSITFRFSLDEEHMKQVEEAIDRQELSYHRVNFIFHIFAAVDSIYKFKDISQMVQGLGDLSYLEK